MIFPLKSQFRVDFQLPRLTTGGYVCFELLLFPMVSDFFRSENTASPDDTMHWSCGISSQDEQIRAREIWNELPSGYD